MNRREAITTASVIFGGAIIGAEAFLSGCSTKPTSEVGEFLNSNQLLLLDEIGETIIPATVNSPGAKEAKIGEFMKVIVRDCYSPEEREIFLAGLDKIEILANEKFDKNFMNLSTQEKHDLLLNLEMKSKQNGDEKHYYSMFKQLTIWGFVSSEPGATKVFRHVDVPGRYDACIPLEKGGKAWV